MSTKTRKPLLIIGAMTLQILSAQAGVLADPCDGNPDSLVKCGEARAQNELNNRVGTTTACAQQIDQLNKANAKWYLEHLSDFRKIDQTMEKLTALAGVKLKSLMDETVSVEPVEGQAEVQKINFSNILKYVEEINIHLKALNDFGAKPADVAKELEKDTATNLNLTSTKLSFKQIRASLPLISNLLNASLSQAVGTFRLVLDTQKFPFELKFNVRAYVNSKRAPFTISLSDYPNSKLRFSEKEKWDSILQTGVLIEGIPADARSRLRALRPQYVKDCRFSIPLSDIRQPFEAVSSQEPTPTAADYQRFAWHELGNLNIPQKHISLNDRGQVLTSGEGARVFAYQTDLYSTIWSFAAVGAARPQSLNSTTLYAVGTNGAVYSTTAKTDQMKETDWTQAVIPFVFQISVTDGAIFGINLNSKIVMSVGQGPWVPLSTVSVKSISAWDQRSVLGLISGTTNGSVVKIGLDKSVEPVVTAPIGLEKIVATGEKSFVALGSDHQLYIGNSAGVEKLSPKNPIGDIADFATNSDGIICAVTGEAGGKKVYCLR